MNWNEFAAEVHQNAVDHGWWEPRPSFAQIVVMCHSELSEAVKEYRDGRPMVWHVCTRMAEHKGACSPGPHNAEICEMAAYPDQKEECQFYHPKPEGVAVEMGDCILRILDVLAEAGVDIDAEIGFSPATKDLIETVALCHRFIAKAHIKTTAIDGSLDGFYDNLLMCMETILDWVRQNDVDMEAVLRAKHAYNKTRPCRHGGKKL